MAGNHLETEERKMVELLKQSDRNAFNTLFRLYASKVYRFSLGYLKCREEAEEIVQDTFVRIWQNRVALDTSYSFGGFVFTIARNLVLKRIRKARNRAICENTVRANAMSEHNPTEERIFYEDLEQMRQLALSELPPKRKIIFQMIRESGMSYQKVAEELNISVKTVESQMTEALKHFRRRLLL